MDIEKVAEEARKSISKFCIEECKAYCCRKGYLAITLKEADLITDGKTKESELKGNIIRKDEGSYVLDLGQTCPRLKNFKCGIHKKIGRPTVCKDFPIFIEGKSIRLSDGCPAVEKKLFYAYEQQFLDMGYELL
jgi:Fe-S-cluster containining protein